MGLLVAWRGARRLGLVTAAAGLLASAVQMLVIIPAFNVNGHNAYASRVAGSPVQQFLGPLTPDTKLVTLAALLIPTAFLAVRSPVALLMVPTLIWRFISLRSFYWGTSYHYSAVLMPIVWVAFVDVLRRLNRTVLPLTASALVTVLLLGQHPFAPEQLQLLLKPDNAAHATRALLDRIPAGTTVSASNGLVPHLTGRDDVSLFGFPRNISCPEYTVVDVNGSENPLNRATKIARLKLAQTTIYRKIAEEGSVTLLHRVAEPVGVSCRLLVGSVTGQ